MTFRKLIAGAAALGAALLLGCGLAASPAQASYIVMLMQVGSNVVASGSGTIDTAGLTFLETTSIAVDINPSAGAIVTGLAGTETIASYFGITGPVSFGGGGGTPVNSGSGDTVGITGASLGLLFVPSGYVSGSALTDSSTYDGQTLGSLGVIPGTYVWRWGSGANADSFTLDAGAAAVPEPGSLALLGLGAFGLVGVAGLRKRRAKHAIAI